MICVCVCVSVIWAGIKPCFQNIICTIDLEMILKNQDRLIASLLSVTFSLKYLVFIGLFVKTLGRRYDHIQFVLRIYNCFYFPFTAYN